MSEWEIAILLFLLAAWLWLWEQRAARLRADVDLALLRGDKACDRCNRLEVMYGATGKRISRLETKVAKIKRQQDVLNGPVRPNESGVIG